MNQQIANKIDEILDYLGIDYYESNGQYRFPCPIHGGRHKNACIYVTDEYEPNWKCWSLNCHEQGPSLVKFLMLTLNKSYNEIRDWLKQFDIQEEKQIDKTFIKTTNTLTRTRHKTKFKIPISEIADLDQHPNFYLKRGFKKETLDTFNIKYCNKKKNPFFGYIIVPVLNDDGKSIAGIVARNPNPECPVCEKYHRPNEPCSKNGMKWKNTKGFKNNSFFYNLWNAKKYIEKTGEVILVEGAADVWRMYEAGIYNVLGMFGTSLSMDQRILLESLPITKVTLFLDPDEAGISSCEKLKKYLERFYTVNVINYEKQPADCNNEEIRRLL